MTNKYETQNNRIKAARSRLCGKHPFFGALAWGLPYRFDDTIQPPTACVNDKEIIWHPEFVEKLTLEETVFVLAHECMHPALMHLLRRGDRKPIKWNIACDIVVNQLLVTNGVGKMPDLCVYEPQIYQSADGKVEAIYDLLPDTIDDKIMDMMGELVGAAEDVKAQWRDKIQAAAATAKAAGNMPGNLQGLVDQLTTPKVKWQDRFRNFVTTTRGKDRTWAKRNRRTAALDLMLPGAEGEQMGELVFAIDCSGSTSDQMVAQCGAELRNIQEELRPEKIHVIYWDTVVQKHEEFEPDDPVEAKVFGRGGTDPRCIWDYIEEHGINPENVVVATDLYFGGHEAFGTQPSYPVLWCVMESSCKDAPWGEVLVVD